MTTDNPNDFPSVVVGDGKSVDDEIDEDEIENIENVSNVTSNVAAVVTEDTTTDPDGDGVRIMHNADTCLALDNNTVINPVSDGFELISNGAGQCQVVDLANVTARNVGTFNPNDIGANDDFVNGEAGVAPCR